MTTHAHYLITINTNILPKTIRDLKIAKANFNKIIKRDILSKTGITRMLKFKEGSLKDVKKVEANYSLEIGSSGRGRLHSHILLKIDLDGKLDWFNKEVITEAISKGFGGRKPYIHVTPTAHEKNLRDYIGKNI